MKMKPRLVIGLLLSITYLVITALLIGNRLALHIPENGESYTALGISIIFQLTSLTGYSVYSVAGSPGDFPSLDLDFNAETQIFGFWIIILISTLTYFMIGTLIGLLIEFLYLRFNKRGKKALNTP